MVADSYIRCPELSHARKLCLLLHLDKNGVANRVTKLLHLEHQCLGEPPPLPQYEKSSTGNDNQVHFLYKWQCTIMLMHS